MAFWIIVAALAAGVTLAITRPLMRSRDADVAPEAPDVAIYKDQLRELDAETARGVLARADAESARTEIARRLIRSSEAANNTFGKVQTAGGVRRTWLYALTSIALPVASLIVYTAFGSPGLPGQPLGERITAEIDASKPNDLIAKVEARLREHPDDGAGWDVIAPIYYGMGRYADAAMAFRNAVNLVGENLQRLQGFADARIRMENGIVPDDAEKALQRILELDPSKTEPKIWLAMAKEQDGRIGDAIADYRKLVAQAPADAPWASMLQDRVAKLEKSVGKADVGAAAAPGSSASAGQGGPPGSGAPPSDNQIAAMSPAEREAFIERMVAGLAARLKADGRDAGGWLQLIRAYNVLGRRDEAVKALNDARAGLKDDRAGLAQVDDMARRLGLGG